MAKGFKRTALCSAILALSYSQPALSRSLIDFDTPYHLRATGQGFLTSSQEGSAYLDGLLPVGGDENRLFFVDGLFMQGRSKQQVSSLALGLRQRRVTMFGDALVGGYIAGDYLKTLKGRNAWVINPGLEILTVNREARLNVYAPLGKRDKTWGSSMASELPQDVIDDSGLPGSDLVRAEGNTFTDTPVALLEEFPTGIELEVGQKITHGAWLRAGAYYFTYKGAKHTEGLQANLDIPLQTRGAHLLFMDSIDNRRNNLFSVGIRFDVGDTGENRAGITKRMTDPLRRHLASVQVGSAVPVRLGYKANGPSETIEDVFFFGPGGGVAPFAPGTATTDVCTAENPCALTQANIDAVENDGAHYFIAGGTYNTNVLTFNGTANGSSEVWGFDSTQFNHQAIGDDRPLINGALFWGNMDGGAAENSSGIVKGLRVHSDNAQTALVSYQQSGFFDNAQIAVGATGNITIENSEISTINILDNGSGNTDNKAIGVFSQNGAMVTNSTISATAGGNANGAGTDTNNDAYGVLNIGTGAVTVSDSTINATTSGNANGAVDGNDTLNDAFGVLNNGDGAVTVTNSTLTAAASGNANGIESDDVNNDAYGVKNNGDGAVTITNSTLTATTGGNVNGMENVDANNDAYGVLNFGAGAVTITNSTLIATASGNANSTENADTDNDAYGVQSFGAGAVTVTNSTLIATASGNANSTENADTDNDAYGVFNNGAMTVVNSTISATASGNANGTGDSNDTDNNASGVFDLSDANVIVTNSTISASASGNADGTGSDNDANNNTYGVRSIGAGAVTVSNSTINASASGNATSSSDNNSHGIETNGDVNINGTTIRVSASGESATDTSTATVISAIGTVSGDNNICIENGSEVDCF